MPIRVANIRLELGEPEESLPQKLAARLGLAPAAIEQWRILRKSLDARSHDDVHFVYAAAVDLVEEDARRIAAIPAVDFQPYVPDRFEWPEPGSRPLGHRPVIVGSGPAGLIAGYALARDGYRPLILERGRSVKDRVADVRRFDEQGPLDPESNYLFGEGGAGTFSDGKLTSRNTGPDVTRVLEILAECHGKPSIVYEQRPHLGSNRLPLVVRTLRRKFEELGGEIRFSCRVEDLDIAEGRLRGLTTSSGYIAADLAILAIGHSAGTLTRCSCAGACRSWPSRFSSACGSSNPRRRSIAPDTARARATRPSGPRTTMLLSARGLATCLLSACAPAAMSCLASVSPSTSAPTA